MAARDQLRKLWRFVDAGNAQGSWALVAARAATMLTAAQAEAARGSDDYVAAALAAQGAVPDPVGTVPPWAFAGTAADGRDLAGLLGYPAFEVGAFVDQGIAPNMALAIGSRHLDRIVATEVADAARVSTGVAMVADRTAVAWVRYLTPPSCGRCVVLAGRAYSTRRGASFLRHPQCFPAGVVVSGPSSKAATRRSYEGELVVLATASGQQLPLTGNHPVLTGGGWRPANLINKGDEVVRSTFAKGAAPLVIPDHYQVPALVEDVWRALGVTGFDVVESTPEDFHGDGQHGEVHVVRADRAFDDRDFVALDKQVAQELLAWAGLSSVLLDPQGMSELFDLRRSAHPGSPIGCGCLSFPLRDRELLVAHEPGLAHRAPFDSGFVQDPSDRPTRDAVLLGQCVFAGTGSVGRHDRLDGERIDRSRWDAPGVPFSMKASARYAGRGLDLLQRLAGQVELDRVVDVRRVQWSGHVYSLSSAEGWHSANSLIVSNCDCTAIPAPEMVEPQSPRATFEAMSDEELAKAGWTQVDIRAIRDGSDVARVVNAHRGLYVAGGRKYTREATTRRGTGRRLRLTPEQIYIEAHGSREEAIRLLRLHGYIL